MDKEFEPGDIVTLYNLVKRLELNDCKARLIKRNINTERWKVQLLDSLLEVNVKLVNLHLIQKAEKEFLSKFIIIENLKDNGELDFDMNFSYNGNQDNKLNNFTNIQLKKIRIFPYSGNDFKYWKHYRTTDHNSLVSKNYCTALLDFFQNQMKPGKGLIILLRFTDIIFLGVITNAKTLEPTMHFHLNESFSEFLNKYNDIDNEIDNVEIGSISLH